MAGVGFSAVLTSSWGCRRRTYLPVELTAKEGVSQEAVYRGEESDGLANVIFAIASTAKVRFQRTDNQEIPFID